MPLRTAIQSRIHALVGFDARAAAELDVPYGDPGLFGPASAAWTVHGDLATMMAGGVGALLMQMLHPAALAGVWDHSDFRRDMAGRLRRTALFLAGTTFGPTAKADALIARVRAVHDHVAGTLPDGTPYSANDPALLTWVHVAEMDHFLRAYMRYRNPAFPVAEQDRYLAETALIAHRLGATDVPASRAAATVYLNHMRPLLRCNDRTRAVAQALIAPPTADRRLRPVADLMLRAGIDLLPGWARRLHGLSLPVPQRAAIRLGTQGMRGLLRWSLTDGARQRAYARMGLDGR